MNSHSAPDALQSRLSSSPISLRRLPASGELDMNGAAGAAAAGAAARAANAIKACGAIVTVRPDEFVNVLNRVPDPLVVVSHGGFFSKQYKYLMSYKGMVFFTKSPTEISVTKKIEWVHADSISIPS